MWILPLSLLIAFELIADILAKEWALNGHAMRWIGAITAYVIANTFWLFALKNGSGLGRGAIIFSVVSAIMAVFIGVVLYREELNLPQKIGVLFGIISLIFISWQGE